MINALGTHLKEISLIPSSGGVFEITVNGKTLFSKKELKRFPEEKELLTLWEQRIGQLP